MMFCLEIDTKSEPCQRFIRESLLNSFTKIFCDEAVQSWKLDIHVNKSKKMISKIKIKIKFFIYLDLYL